MLNKLSRAKWFLLALAAMVLSPVGAFASDPPPGETDLLGVITSGTTVFTAVAVLSLAIITWTVIAKIVRRAGK